MSRMNDYHRRLEKLFADLLSTEAQLPPDGRYWITHYIDHGEYELALENAIASFQKDGPPISLKGKHTLIELAKEMELTDPLALIDALGEIH